MVSPASLINLSISDVVVPSCAVGQDATPGHECVWLAWNAAILTKSSKSFSPLTSELVLESISSINFAWGIP